MTLFYFFLLFTLLLGTRLSPAFARLKTRKKKEETNKGESHPKNVGTELELSLNPFRCPVCFAINILDLTHPPTHPSPKKNATGNCYHEAFLFILYADKKYKTSVITTTVSSKQLYIKRGSPNLFLESLFFFFYILMSIFFEK